MSLSSHPELKQTILAAIWKIGGLYHDFLSANLFAFIYLAVTNIARRARYDLYPYLVRLGCNLKPDEGEVPSDKVSHLIVASEDPKRTLRILFAMVQLAT